MVRVRKNVSCNVNTNTYLKVIKKDLIVANQEKKSFTSNKVIKSSVNFDNNDDSNSLLSNNIISDNLILTDIDDSKKNINIPDWYDSIISSKFNIPLMISNKHNYSCVPNNYIGFGNNEYNDKHVRLYNFNHKSKQQFVNTKFIDNDENLQILKDKALKTKNTALSKCIDESDKNISKIKAINTKYNNIIHKLDKITTCDRHVLLLTYKQKSIIHKWIIECNKLYNKCVEIHNSDNDYFSQGYMNAKLKVFKDFYGDKDKPAPYDMLTDEVRIFCSNLKSCKTNMSRSHISHYELKPRNIYEYKFRSIFIPKTSITKNSIYGRHLGKINGMENVDLKIVNLDCRLIYNKLFASYTLLTPILKERIEIENRESIVALDPGEKIFLTLFSPNNIGFIGDNVRDIFLRIRDRIAFLQRVLKKGNNKEGYSLRNKNKIKKKIEMEYEKMKNIRNELHNKAALYLCKTYDTILLPVFETQKMVSEDDSSFGAGKRKIKKAYEEGEDKGREERKKYKKGKRLNKKIKFVLNQMSHYKFKQHLINKANEYGCKVEIVTEEYTSKACTKCGSISNTYEYRKKTCENCKYTVDRDLNGARNIFIKNIKKYIPLTSESKKIRKENVIKIERKREVDRPRGKMAPKEIQQKSKKPMGLYY